MRQELRQSPTLSLNNLSLQLIEKGKEVIKFGFGQSPFPVPDLLVEELKLHAHNKNYLPSQGIPELRESISDYYSSIYNDAIDPSDIIIGPGSKQLIFSIQLALRKKLILPSPSWVSYNPQATMLGLETHWIDTDSKNGWKLNANQLDNYAKSNDVATGLLILNSPNNPTGSVYTSEELQALSAVIKKLKLIVISDEIYGDVCHSADFVSIRNYCKSQVIVCNGLSKWAGAGGWRFGVSIIPEELRDLKNLLIGIASETFSCVPAPIQYAAIKAYQPSQEIVSYKSKINKVLALVADYVRECLEKTNIIYSFPEGGFYTYLDFENYRDQLAHHNVTTSSDLTQKLLRDTGVALLSGDAFGQKDRLLTARLAYVDFDGKELLNAIGHINSTQDILEYIPKIETGLNKIAHWINNFSIK